MATGLEVDLEQLVVLAVVVAMGVQIVWVLVFELPLLVVPLGRMEFYLMVVASSMVVMVVGEGCWG